MSKEGMKSKIYLGNRGQVTIFIIIALVIVVAGVLVFLLSPKLKTSLGLETQNPSAYMEECLTQTVEENIEKISLQGGVLNPQPYYLYQDSKLPYLCYTSEIYKPCVIQKPFIIQDVQTELKNSVEGTARECLDSLVSYYQGKGYEVELSNGEVNVEFLPQRVVVAFTNSLTLTRENTVVYGGEQLSKQIRLVLNNNLYELLSIATSILNFEAKYGDSEITTYMFYYRDLKVEKLKQTDGTKVYILTDKTTGNKFQFATRSLVFPAGYGFDQ